MPSPIDSARFTTPRTQRDLGPAIAPPGHVVDVDAISPSGTDARDGPLTLAAHHHALDDGLAAHGAAGWGASDPWLRATSSSRTAC